VRIRETARISALSWRLHLDEADKRIMDDHGVIRAGLKFRQREVFSPSWEVGWLAVCDMRMPEVLSYRGPLKFHYLL
jgi:hypothetical protein